MVSLLPSLGEYSCHFTKGSYICIEVSPDFTIRQAFGPCNNELDGEAFKAYSEWCQEKHIVRRKAFSIHCAPGRIRKEGISIENFIK